MPEHPIRLAILSGTPRTQIARDFGVTTATISYHAGKVGLIQKPRVLYPWSEIQKEIAIGVSVQSLCDKYGFSRGAYSRAVKEGRLKPYPRMIHLGLAELAATLKGGRATSHFRKIARRLIAASRGWRCAECDLETWRGKPLTLEVDHIDGNSRHNHEDNLRLLCPNCHSVTDTWRGRNVGR